MYCPKCGQQAFDEVRFCSRCGFRLDGVTALLDHDTSIAQPPLEPPASKRSAKQKGMRFGVKLIFFSIVLAPIFFAISISRDVDTPAPMLVPITIFLLGLMRLLYSVIFEEEHAPANQKPQPLQVRAFNQTALPPPPASVTAPRRVKTADMINPPSITENTTNLLDKK
jgi:hypothetical protein